MFNLKKLKTVSMMIFLLGGIILSNTVSYAEIYNDVSTANAVLQQNQSCTGIVKDASGEAIIGASVVLKGTLNGVNTDTDGKFVLRGVKKGDILQISLLGYKTVEVVFEGEPLEITLEEDTEALEEVVVVGFSTQAKSKVTGAISTLGSKEIESRPINSVVDAMQGAIPGLNFFVGNLGGALNSTRRFNIRGQGNLGQGSTVSPLILIDGMEGDINALNPQDIESMSVLKDASTASIYGSRAAGGVILITTRSGREGKTIVNYNNSFRFNSPLNMPEMMDSYTWALYMNEASINAGYGVWFSDSKLAQIKKAQTDPTMPKMFANYGKNKWEVWGDPVDLAPVGNTDWLKEHFGGSNFSQEHNLNFSGGTSKYTYYFSANYLSQEGILRHGNENKQRYTITGKLNAQLFKWLNAGYSVRFSRVNFTTPSEIGDDGGLFYHNVCRYWPILPTHDPNGNYLFESYISVLKDGGRYKTEDDNFSQQFTLTIMPLKGWTINADLNYRITNWNRHIDWLPVYEYDLDNIPHVIYNFNTSVREDASKGNYFNPNIFTEYSHDWKGHYLKVMLGFQSEMYNSRSVMAQGFGILSGLTTINTTSTDPHIRGDYQHWATAGFFGRLNYDYNGRYLFEASFRYDGSSRFIRENRWGFFPSFSLGWNIAREPFMKKTNTWLNLLTIRGSWGELGNQNTNNWYPFYPKMRFIANGGGWLLDGKRPNIASQPDLVSSSLTWETMRTWEVGLNWAMFNHRLSGTFGYFQRKTLNMVGPAPELPAILGIGVPQVNNTELTSRGWDLQVSWRDRIKDFDYGIVFNLSDDDVVIDKYPNDSHNLGQWFKGRKIGDIYGFTTIGIAKTQDEMNAHLAKVDQSQLGSNWGAGDIMFADINGDGVIDQGEYLENNSGDWTVIGNSNPHYNFGLNIDMAYKGFSLKVFFQGVLKRDYMPSGSMFWGGSQNKWQACGFKPHLDYFRTADSPLGENLDGYYPRVAWDSWKNLYSQTRYLQNAAYCRLKNVTLAYALPNFITEKFYVENLRIFVSLENMWTITKFSKMADPEMIDAGGWDFGKMYPLSKTVSFGLNLTF